ncbi:MAG: PKD domain-containing protein [Vicingaceae bacterium]
MLRTLQITLTLILLTAFGQLNAQLTQEGSSVKSSFRKNFESRRVHNNKSTSCGVDTLYYAQYNATSFNYINIVPSGVTGAGLKYTIDDTVWLYGVNFYAYALSNSTPVNVRVYYSNATDNRPAGLPLATVSKTLNTGFPIWLAPNLQKVTFQNPIQLLADFVITVETTNSTTMVFASNDWVSGDGNGQFNSSIKVSTGWVTNINVGGVTFDADFYIEPVLGYKLNANFEGGSTSCIGNGLPYDFINTSTHVLNPQFSPEQIDGTLADNFTWDYGDGSALENKVDGQHSYSSIASYPVKLSAVFNNWTGSCLDDTTILVEEPTLNASFTSTAQGLLVNFKDQSTDAKQWNWNFGDGSNGSVTRNPSHVYPTYSTYSVKLTVRNGGCESQTTLSLKLTDPTIGIENSTKGIDFSIQPNPSSDYIQVLCSGLNGQSAAWELFSIQGSRITSGKVAHEERIDVSNIERGVYFLSLIHSGSTATQRLLIK